MHRLRAAVALVALLVGSVACQGANTLPVATHPRVDRVSMLPETAVKVLPADDPTPPVLHSDEFDEPVPVPVISTAGAEDAPFIPVGEDTMYFFFAADPNLDPSFQLRDPGNGIWVSERVDGVWQEATLVWLQDPGVLALNGCPVVVGDEIVFCTAREGQTGLGWFRAERHDEGWRGWTPIDYPADLEVGELHLHGPDLYYGSSRDGGMGGDDIWRSTLVGGAWTAPENITGANSTSDDTRPFVTGDGRELWITRWHEGSPAIFRSRLVDGGWAAAELIVSQFAGEPTLDGEGNLYFVHHFLRDGVIVEADIYVAPRR